MLYNIDVDVSLMKLIYVIFEFVLLRITVIYLTKHRCIHVRNFVRKKPHTKTLAKIQVTGIFLMKDMRRNVFPKFIEICMETPCWCPPRWAPTWRPETNRNICH